MGTGHWNGLAGKVGVDMKFYWLILAVLAVWRVTHLLNAEDGPWDVIFRLRRWAGTGFWASLMDCFYCLSLWIAAPTAYLVGTSWMERGLLWPAISGAAILLERLVPDKMRADESYSEVEEKAYVLREESTDVENAERREDDGRREQFEGGHLV
jgi:hypothetical protein